MINSKVDWQQIWVLIQYILKNYLSEVVIYIVAFCALGLLLSAILTFVLFKFKFLNRNNKYYHWATRLIYVPGIFIVNTIFSFQLGVVNGGYKALLKDSPNISNQIYEQSVVRFVEDQEERKALIKQAQTYILDLQASNKSMKISLSDLVKNSKVNIKPIDQTKDKIANYYIQKYGDKIHALATYAMLKAAMARVAPHANSLDEMSFEEFEQALQFVLSLDAADVEKSIVNKINEWVNQLLGVQFKSIISGIVLIWILILLIPFVEYFIYKMVQKKRLPNAADVK